MARIVQSLTQPLKEYDQQIQLSQKQYPQKELQSYLVSL
jgi:hypothetical protein